MNRFSKLAVLCLTVTGLALSGCGSDDDSHDNQGNNAGGNGGNAGQTIKIGATFLDYLTKQPIEGLQVCTLIPEGRDPGCATTGADGKIVAPGFPTNSKLLFQLTKEGYFTTLIPAVSGTKDDTDSQIYPVKKESVDSMLKAAGLSLESGKAVISFLAVQGNHGKATDDGLEDVTVTISSGDKPVYMKALTFDPNATATDVAGLGVFLNLDPDKEYTLTFHHKGSPAKTCKTRLGWTAGSDAEATVPTKADTITYVLSICE